LLGKAHFGIISGKMALASKLRGFRTQPPRCRIEEYGLNMTAEVNTNKLGKPVREIRIIIRG
jgi:hypothetical protein